MPAHRIQDTAVAMSRFDTGGVGSSKDEEFVRHVGLALEAVRELTRRSPHARLIHMGPPLGRDPEGNATELHAIATAELTADEQLQIGVFVDELESEYEAERARPRRQYVIHPHAVPPTQQFPFPRFSCAGFVIEAYRDAGIELLVTGEGGLPEIPLETLIAAYPDQASRLDKPEVREMFGLEGSGPWPVVLAGYVLNAMARTSSEIREMPYVARSGDEFFPKRGG